MRKKMEFEWDCIEATNSQNSATWRAKVIGGWILKEEYYSKKDKETPINATLTFIPDRDHEWTIVPPAKEVEAQKPTVKAADFDPK